MAVHINILAIGMLLLPSMALAAFWDKKDDPDRVQAEQQSIREMRTETLEKLYQLNPEAEQQVQDSKAVAVFSSLGFNIFLLSTARGGGVVQDTQTGDETFMRMFSVGGGLGMGVKDFRVVFIFHTDQAYENFLSQGWDFSGQGDGAAKVGDEGTSVDLAATVVDGVSLYQITENGLALQVTLQGTRYYRDKDLN